MAHLVLQQDPLVGQMDVRGAVRLARQVTAALGQGIVARTTV